MSGRTILVTGSSGYLGRALIRALEEAPWCQEVLGWDVREPVVPSPKLRFERVDVTAQGLNARLAAAAPDCLVHLAFVVNPMHDEELQRRINLDGTRNVFTAAAGAGTGQIVVASSGTAYGAFRDNPVPLRETDPCRPHPGFPYARQKAELEIDYARFMEAHPEVDLAIIRPCVVFGPGVSNYLADLLTALPVVVGLAGYDPPLQFVHEDDVAGVIAAIVEQRARGPFNVAPPDSITVTETVMRRGRPVVRLPDWILGPFAALAWRLHLPILKAPPAFLDFMRWPWVMDTTRVTQELGYAYRHSSRDTLEIMLRARTGA